MSLFLSDRVLTLSLPHGMYPTEFHYDHIPLENRRNV